jgi:hypothetical protein
MKREPTATTDAFMRKLFRVVAVSAAMLGGSVVYVLYPPEPRLIEFPEGKRFAFTIVDDTDMVTLQRARPLYELLHRYGLRTTKTIWMRESSDLSHPANHGDSLQDPDYRKFIVDLRDRGFEIALHGIRGGSSERADILNGLDEFRDVFGTDARIHVNHSLNRDNVYWGSQRWSFPPYRWLYSSLRGEQFFGEDPESAHFWGDYLERRVTYVNQFTFSDINLLNVTPSFPYHLPEKPYVNLWFPTANGNNLDTFAELLSNDSLDRLESEGGVTLVYTHLASGSFNRDDGSVQPRFEAIIREVASRDGWFAPASEILDYLQAQPGWQAEPSWRERIRLETIFLWDSIVNP